MIKKRFREYFTYTKKERNGLVVLFLILFLLILVKIYQSNISYGEIVLIDDEFKKDIESFEKSLILKQKEEKEKRATSFKQKANKSDKWHNPEVLFNFDPNKVSKSNLKKLGFSKKQINTLANYREKGGVFYQNEDLLKIYGIKKKQFDILDPYINIISKNKQEIGIVNNEGEELLLELNTASKEDLINLKGIGDSYAERIIKYRDLLGGYSEKNQILEVYGMDSLRYTGIINNLFVDTIKIKKLNINNVDFKTLVRHPYINKYQTGAILKYRELEGSFTEIEQIHQNNLLLIDEYLKLKPYLKLK